VIKAGLPETVEISRLPDTATALADLLAAGAIDSRSAIAALRKTGASPKQIRSARERLGLVIVRQGNGRAMRSFWALPAINELATATPPVHQDTKSAQPAVPGAPDQGDGVQFDGRSAAVSPADSRVTRRVEFFQARGLGQVEAHDLATALEARDQAGGTAVSCAECQCWVQPAWCSTRRPAIELHACTSSRRDGP
jgi:hypothetical protein